MIQDKKSKLSSVNRTYRHRINIYKYESYENEYLQNEQRLAKVLTLYADIKPIRGRELMESNLKISETTYRLTTYYRPEISQDMYIEWPNKAQGSKWLEIESVLNVSGREAHMELMAKEVQRPSGYKV